MDPNLVLTWIYFFKQLLCSFTRTWNTATICKLGPGHLEMADSLTWNLPSLRHLAIKTQTLMCFELQFFKNIFSPIDSLFQISQISEVLPIIQPTEVHKSVTWTRLFLVTYSSSLLPRPEAGLRWHVSFCSRRVLGQLEWEVCKPDTATTHFKHQYVSWSGHIWTRQQCPWLHRILKLTVKLTRWLWAKWEDQTYDWDYTLALKMSILRHLKGI